MNRVFAVLLSLCLLLTGCGREDKEEVSEPEPESIAEESEEESIEEEPEISLEEESGEENTEEESGLEEEESQAPEESVDETTRLEEAAPQRVEPERSPPEPPPSQPESSAVEQSSRPSRAESSAPEKEESGGAIVVIPSADSPEGSASNYLAQVEAEVIRLINEHRASLGIARMQTDGSLRSAARVRSWELYRNNHFAHTRPDGRGWQSVLLDDVPVSFTLAGENLARVEHNMKDYDPAKDAAYWFDTWRNSPGHYENMVRPEYTDVGVGIHYIQKGGMIYGYATTLFAKIE